MKIVLKNLTKVFEGRRKKDPDVTAVDNFDFQRFTESMRSQLASGSRQRRLLSYNAIMSEWYLQWIEKDLQEPNAVDKDCFH